MHALSSDSTLEYNHFLNSADSCHVYYKLGLIKSVTLFNLWHAEARGLTVQSWHWYPKCLVMKRIQSILMPNLGKCFLSRSWRMEFFDLIVLQLIELLHILVSHSSIRSLGTHYSTFLPISLPLNAIQENRLSNLRLAIGCLPFYVFSSCILFFTCIFYC